ncbi:MAG: ribonuclease P protein component [Alphaproteobacteria bacterium]|nr:ribonuclease P protein component [Alphaproteobacteria bacterium]
MCASVNTLKASSDFKHIAKLGRKWVGAAFILQVLKEDAAGENPSNDGAFAHDAFRLGLTVSRRVGNAVKRNRAKRRLRETVRLLLKSGGAPAPCDLVIIAKSNAVTHDFAALQRDLARGLKALGVAGKAGSA